MFYKQNGIVAGILLLILFAGAIGLVSVQMDKTVNRMHYSVVEEMGEYRTELIRQDFQKTAELVESMQDYLATRGYQKEQFEELIALLIRQDNKVSRIWFETEGKRTICTDSGIRESEAGPSKERNGGLYAEDSTYYWTLYGRQGEVALGIDIALDHLHAYFSNLLPAGKNYAYILNDSGVIVAHPEEKWLGMRLLDSLERRRVKQVVGENKRIHVTGFSQFLLLPVDKIYYPLTVGTEKCTVVINVVQLDNQEAMADFHRYALWIVVFTVVIFIVLLAYSQRRWRKEYDLRQKAEQEAIRLNLQQLKNQLNPHFLFNTLNSLRFVAAMHNDQIVSDGIQALSSLLQNTLTNKNEYITVQEELENLENYFAILRIRYAGSFEYSFHIEDDELLSCLVPKLILQPLAENSVMHGSSDDGSVMKIHITCWEEDGHMILELQDNGKGFEMTQTDLNPHKDRKKIGVANVNDRIHLNFGRKYGLKINSHPGEGTTCTLTLPELYADTLSQHPEE